MPRDPVDKRTRILVIEDADTTRNMYIRALEVRGDYRVDGAANLEEALAAIESCAYQVALVDIMLAGPQDAANRDGTKVLDRVRELDEGTRTIVLSAQDEPQLARDFLFEHGAHEYLAKNTLQEVGIGRLVELVELQAQESPIGAEVPWEALVVPLAGERDEPMFVSEVMGAISFKGGFENLRRSLTAAMRHLWPLLPERGSGQGLSRDESNGFFTGRFWSKGQGCAVEVRLDRESGGPDGDAVMLTREKGGLRVAVSRLPDEPREAFAAGG